MLRRLLSGNELSRKSLAFKHNSPAIKGVSVAEPKALTDWRERRANVGWSSSFSSG